MAAAMWLLYNLIICIGLVLLALAFTPKSHPDKLVIKTSIILTAVCLYLLWAIAFMAQLNPLIQPKPHGIR
ncbi:hypothetical protein MIR68_003449 [Amoeboaphelidium protococcarum]|nr:hypothetical protein MIR68_003449 [Amoeboaphelidium protococcarum]KAI3652428.1 hypothetical protein MP228_002753 [Amoeboaphelidium protococcarum]KAI3654278.1 hypothetical protein MP228_000997 [Amoeboaphelidium protococcarum]